MAKSILLDEQIRSGECSNIYNIAKGMPGRIIVKMVSNSFGVIPGFNIKVDIHKSFDGGISWKHAHGFTSESGHADDFKDGLPSVNFGWDGEPMQIRISGLIPIQFRCGFTIEII